jgi:magnesium chelatase family protein
MRTYGLTRVGQSTRLVTVEADVTEGLPEVVLRGLPNNGLREARDRIRAAIVNSGEQWPSVKITISLSPTCSSVRISSLDHAIAIAILAAAGDVPHIQLASTLFRAELGLDGRLRSTVGIDELLAAATRDELPAIQEDNALVLVVPTHDVPAAMEAISQSRTPYVRVVGARHLRDVIAWLRGETRLDLALVENQPE